MPGKNGRPLVFGTGPFTIVDHVSGDSWQESTISMTIVRIMRSLDLFMVRNHICILLYNLQFWDFFVKLLSIDSSESGLLSISAKDLTFAPNLNQERRVFQKESGFSMLLKIVSSNHQEKGKSSTDQECWRFHLPRWTFVLKDFRLR